MPVSSHQHTSWSAWGAVKTDLAQLGTRINQLTRDWDATEEVDTNLGSDVETAGQLLLHLAGTLTTTLTLTDPLRAAQLQRFSVKLADALDHYADLDEHETDASIDIFDRLNPGLALLHRIIAVQDDPAATARVTAGELIERLRQFPADHEVWVGAQSAPAGCQPLNGDLAPGRDPAPTSGDSQPFIVLGIDAGHHEAGPQAPEDL